MKKRKTRISARQVLVNHIDASIIVKQQQIIAEYERFNEHLLLMLKGDPERMALKFSDDVLGAEFILKEIHGMLECLHIIKKKDGK